VIEALLCHGEATIPEDLLGQVSARLTPFTDEGLARLHGRHLAITPAGLPYARVIAALFDAYRAAAPRTFSSAI